MKLLNNLNAINKLIINAVQLMYNFGQDKLNKLIQDLVVSKNNMIATKQ